MKRLTLGMMMAVVSLVATGQVITPASPFLLNVDYARFLNSDSTGYSELYYLFYPSLVTVAKKADGSYGGKIFLRVTARETGTGTAYINELRALPVSVKDSAEHAAAGTMVSLAGYVLPFGTYSFAIIAYDSMDASRKDSLTFTFTMSGLPDEPSMSDLELCSRIQQATGSGAFVKNTLEVVPNATLMFGVSNHPVVFHYVELYNLSSDIPYTISSRVLDAGGNQVKATDRQRQFSVSNTVDVGTMNVTSLPSGRYMYEVVLLDNAGAEVTRTRKVFYIYNPHIKQAEPSGASLKASELAGLDFDELGLEFEQASYLALSNEKDAFAKLTTADARREFLSAFWTSVEKGREGRDPITRSEYLRRVQVALQKYRLHSRPGWRTDRGRVYLLYGDPDEIERVPSDEQVKPYEIWSYYRIENGVQFVFVDRTGFGDYILVHSTKRGELQDESWQRMLR